MIGPDSLVTLFLVQPHKHRPHKPHRPDGDGNTNWEVLKVPKYIERKKFSDFGLCYQPNGTLLKGRRGRGHNVIDLEVST